MTQIVKIEAILDEIVTLPSLPGTVTHIMEILDNPNTQLPEVAKAIASDPALSLKTLRLVNSAYYGLRDNVNSVERGIVLLGMKVVRNLVLTASVFETLQCSEDTLLRHCIACGTASRILAKNGKKDAPFPDPEEAFTYGLLHDVGKIIMQHSLPAEWARIGQRVRRGEAPAHVIENNEIGVDHAQLGGQLAQRWKLQEGLVAAIAGHHDLTRCFTPMHRRRAAFVGVSDWLCNQAGLPALEGALAAECPGMWQESGFDPDRMGPFVEALVAERDAIDELVRLAN